MDERERQAKCRRRRRERVGTTVKSGRMSRAGLPLQVAELEGLMLRKWDKILRLSRAGLARDLRSLLGSIGEKVARSGWKEGGCHEPA